MYQNYLNTPLPMTMNGQYPNTYSQVMRQEIVKVNGENGARAYQLAANSSVLLLDETNPIVWLVQTDGAGYKTVSPFSITPYQPAPAIDVNSLEERISRLEAKINEPNTFTNERKEYQPATSNANVEQSKKSK